MKSKKIQRYSFLEKQFNDTKTLISEGQTYYSINKLVEQGILKKVTHNLFETTDYNQEENDFFYVSAYVKKGVICLMSAAVYYGLSTFRPTQIDVAIEHKDRIFHLPEWPKIVLYYFSENRFNEGIKEIKQGKNVFRIYDIEKTVCDILSYRNKIGLEDSLSVLKNYLNTDERDLNKLIHYAKKLRVYNILKRYLEVLL